MTADYFFMVRLGETKAGEREIEAGPLDYPLLKKALKAALSIDKSFSKEKITVVHRSSVFPAYETAKILAFPIS